MNVVQRVKEAVVRALDLQVTPAEMPDDEVLFGGGLGASSIAVMEVHCRQNAQAHREEANIS